MLQKVTFKGSIQKRLIWIMLFVTSITTFVGYSSFVSWYVNDQYEKSLALSKTVAQVLSQDFAKIVLLNEVAVAAEISTKLQSFDTVDSLVLYKKDKTPIYQFSALNKSFKVNPLPSKELRVSTVLQDTLTLYLDAIYLGNHIGYIELKLHVFTLGEIIKSNLLLVFGLYIFMIMISYFLALFFSKRFTKPIVQLVTFLEKVELSSILYERVESNENNEYGKLYQEVNFMLERMENAYKESKIAAVAFETQSGMTITDAQHKILKINQAFSDITGYTPEEAIGKTPAILKSGLQGDEFYLDMLKTLKIHNYWSGEIYNRHKDGSIFPEYLTIQSVLDENKNPLYYVASFIDLTLQKETEAKLQYLKQYDTLTGLINKELFINSIQEGIDAKGSQKFGALISFDIKEFKNINDAYGHNNGDLLLQQIAQRTKESCQKATLLARVGADVFMLWFEDIAESKEEASIKSKTITYRLNEAFSKVFEIAGAPLHADIHIGISLSDAQNRDASSLFIQAETALHSAKNQDKEYAFFDKQAQSIAINHLDMYTQLREALKENQFELFYQLQYKGDKPYGAEALIRWIHPVKGLIPPVNFIPLAEKSGLILPMGEWVIEEACKELAAWQKNPKTKEWVMAVNVSPKQFKEAGFLQYIQENVQKNKIEYSSLKIELTESILSDNITEVIEKMGALQKLGVKTSLDDFGTGYSSLEYLKELPLNQIKIDQSFVRNILNDKNDIAIVKSILLIGEAKGLEVIAEGVETKEHFEFLKTLGCHYFQGYYFARPQRSSDFNF